MITRLLGVYDIYSNIQGLFSYVATTHLHTEASGISGGISWVATSALKALPGLGWVTGSTVNAVVARSTMLVLGIIVAVVLEFLVHRVRDIPSSGNASFRIDFTSIADEIKSLLINVICATDRSMLKTLELLKDGATKGKLDGEQILTDMAIIQRFNARSMTINWVSSKRWPKGRISTRYQTINTSFALAILE